MSENEFINQEIRDQVCIITLNNPKSHNAFDEKIINSLTKILQSIEKSTDVKILILRSAGKHFSAGADLNWMQRMSRYTLQENEADARLLAKLLQTLDQFAKPTIALANGRAMGGAAGLLACCDIVIAHDTAKFCFSEVKLGLIPATIAPYIINKIGYSQARYYFISGELFNAATAKAIGLVHHVINEDTDLLSRALELAKSLLKNGPQAMCAAKKLVDHFAHFDQTLIDDTVKLLAQIRASSEGKEGVQAFLDKRQPKWCQDHA